MPVNPDPGKKIVVLFWNLDGQRLVSQIENIVNTEDVDVLLLAESPFKQKPDDLLEYLNRAPRPAQKPEFQLPDGEPEPRVQLFERISGAAWTAVIRRSRYTIWSVDLPGARRFICAAAHFPSIQEDQNDGQRECGMSLRLDLQEAESGWDSPVSFVIGDLNAHPFDAGISGVYGLNGTRLRNIAQGKPRTLNGQVYPWMYNPMWAFLGTDPPAGTHGTFYRRFSSPICYDWFLLDQVLVRPSMIRLFNNDRTQDIKIITSAGSHALTQDESGVPNHRLFSKHLPLLFRFFLPEE